MTEEDTWCCQLPFMYTRTPVRIHTFKSVHKKRVYVYTEQLSFCSCLSETNKSMYLWKKRYSGIFLAFSYTNLNLIIQKYPPRKEIWYIFLNIRSRMIVSNNIELTDTSAYINFIIKTLNKKLKTKEYMLSNFIYLKSQN